MRRLAFLACVLLAGCARDAASPDQLLRRAALEMRHGNLTEARRQVASAEVRWTDSGSPWYWRFRLLDAEIVLAEGRAEEARKLLAAPVPRIPDQASLEARRRMHLANAALKSADLSSATRLLDEARALAPPSEAGLRLDIDVLRGAVLSQSGSSAADALLRASYVHAVDLGDPYNQAAVLNNLGYNRMKRFRYDEAIPYYMRALSAAEQCDASRFLSSILGNLAICHYRLGDFEKALQFRKQAMAIQTHANARRNLQASLGEIGNIYLLQGQPRQAIPFYRDALALAREVKAIDFASFWAVNLAQAYAELQDWDAAGRMNAEVRVLQEARGDARVEAQLLLNDAGIAAGRGQTGAAARIYKQVIASAAGNPAVLWAAHADLADLYTRAGRPAQAAPHFESALRVIGETRAGLLRSEYKITFLNALIRFYRRYVDALVDRGEAERALQIAESSRARLLAENLGMDRLKATANRDYRAIARSSGAVLLSYWLGPSRSLLWVVTADRIRLFPLPPEDRIRQLTEAWNRVISDLRDPLQNPNPAGARLSEILLGPARGFLRPGSRIVLVPDGVLHRLNFETLPAGDHYWIEDAAIAVAPALGVLASPAADAGRRPSVLLIGDPAYRSPEFPKLPYASEELAGIERSFAGAAFSIFTGPDAQPAAYRSADPGRFSMIHFAAHAAANRDSPLDSAIVLAPDAQDSFKLYARDVLESPLHARLVTISACRSAGARSYSGEGLVGLAWAFLQAGAENVIGGLWDVSDRSTALLMRDLYSGLARGDAAPDALRNAKLALAHSRTAYRKPFYWGPFLLYSRVRPWAQ